MIPELLSEVFPPKSHFEPERDISDLTGKVVIVTGGNNGIGKETVKQLLKKNAKVYLAARSQERGEAAIAELQSATGKIAHFLELDLASLDKTTMSAKEFMSKEKGLHILFNNAGVMKTPMDDLTADGYDLQWGTNTLGHAHFTLCLLPALLEGAKSSPDGKSRVINVSSDAAYGSGIKWETLKDGPERRKLSPLGLYFQSKFGNYVFSCELARRYGDQDIISNALSPGHIITDLQRNIPRLILTLTNWTRHPVDKGALTQLWAGASPETADFNGKWFVPWARERRFLGHQNEAELGPKLWEWIEEQRKSHI
ncbi:hypothetical protein FRB90_012371 [Tulasnella sp. 427]|nr:hypothetical protein FRB90_012371 [Tulasnella sp. 427]